MALLPPPAFAAWRHTDVREGFEVVWFERAGDGWRIEGHATGVEPGEGEWGTRYVLEVDAGWHTRRAHVTARSGEGAFARTLETDGRGAWRIDGAAAPHLDGCPDVDLEASACTNTLPVHRLALAPGSAATQAPAAYVRAVDLRVERLEQTYARLEDDAGDLRFAYTSPVFDFAATLRYDAAGLVLDYPGIAVRAT